MYKISCDFITRAFRERYFLYNESILNGIARATEDKHKWKVAVAILRDLLATSHKIALDVKYGSIPFLVNQQCQNTVRQIDSTSSIIHQLQL